MSDLQYRPGGSLKLKGDDGGKKKKSKKKNPSKVALTGEEPIKSEALLKKIEKEKETESKKSQARESASPGPAPEAGPSNPPVKTAAERKFEEAQRRRLLDKVSKMASKTHKDRVSEFNSKLESLSEHHDIPKVGPG